MSLKTVLYIFIWYLLFSCNKPESLSIKLTYSITDTFINVTIDNQSTQIDSIKINNDKLILNKKQKVDIYPIDTSNRFYLFFKDTTILTTLSYDLTKKFEPIANKEFALKVLNSDTIEYTYQIVDVINNKTIAENSKRLKNDLLIMEEITDKAGKFLINISWTKKLYLKHNNTKIYIELIGKSLPIEIESKAMPNNRFN